MSRLKGPDFATGKPVVLSAPEEKVRQEYERILVESYRYSQAALDIEVRIPRGAGHFSDRADLVVYRSPEGRDPTSDILGIVETKNPGRKDGLAQLKSYLTATSATWGVWTNGEDIAYLYREGARVLDDYLNNIPVHGQSIEDIGRLTKADLEPFRRDELKSAFRRILNTLYANTSISRREKLGNEMIKIVFAKLQDEQTFLDQPPHFRVQAGEPVGRVAGRVKQMFHRVRDEFRGEGIFTPHEDITLDDRSLAWVVGQLERGSLLKTDSDVVGDAFEVFSESKFIGEKGEFFTPRGVVRIAVKLTSPRHGDRVCDPACGSGGFLIHAMKQVWRTMADDPEWKGSSRLRDQQRAIAARSFFGIDKETDLVKIAKAHLAISGDGRSNIVHENSLHRADEFVGEARACFLEKGRFREFDIVLTNPPLGTKTKVSRRDAANFRLGHRHRRKGTIRESLDTVDRDPYVLFVERAFELLRDGGTLGIVLPDTVFHAPSLEFLRDFITRGNSIVAVIDLPHNTFRPHCNAKTCLLVVEKGRPQGERIIMATPRETGHDLRGDPLYRPGTNEIWNDLSVVLDELDDPDAEHNDHVFTIPSSALEDDLLKPTFYRARIKETPTPPEARSGVTLGQLVQEGVVEAWDGHGSPANTDKGAGSVPYIRVKDIVNWEMYRDPTAGVPEGVWERMTRNKRMPEEGDVILVRRGSYRIGTVAMAAARDRRVLLTRELLTLRVRNLDNRYGITPFYLLALLSSTEVQQQVAPYVFVDTTLPNIGDRWRYLVLPVHRDRSEAARVSAQVETAMRCKWKAHDIADELRGTLGDLVT